MGVTNLPDGLNIGSEGGASATFQIGGTAVTSTAAELNYADGLLGKALAFDSATPYIVAAGTLAGTVGGTVASGLSVAPTYVTASLGGAGTGSFVATARAGSGGSVIIEVYNSSGAAATDAGTVTWLAIGTAA